VATRVLALAPSAAVVTPEWHKALLLADNRNSVVEVCSQVDMASVADMASVVGTASAEDMASAEDTAAAAACEAAEATAAAAEATIRDHRSLDHPASSDGTTILYIGAENWPLPLPFVNKAGAGYFDTEAGRQEIMFRRIGKNEVAGWINVKLT
jgi:hypothetical protein